MLDGVGEDGRAHADLAARRRCGWDGQRKGPADPRTDLRALHDRERRLVDGVDDRHVGRVAAHAVDGRRLLAVDGRTGVDVEAAPDVQRRPGPPVPPLPDQVEAHGLARVHLRRLELREEVVVVLVERELLPDAGGRTAVERAFRWKAVAGSERGGLREGKGCRRKQGRCDPRAYPTTPPSRLRDHAVPFPRNCCVTGASDNVCVYSSLVPAPASS